MYAIEGPNFLSSFKNSTPWMTYAQNLVAGDAVKQAKKIEEVDTYKTFVAISGEFEHAKPTIEDKDGKIEIKSYSHSFYDWRTSDILDAANYYASEDIGAKFKSREAIYKHLGLDFTTTKEATCKELNQAAYDYAVKNFKDTHGVMDKFNKYGQQMEFLDDVESSSGPTWVNR